MRDLNKLRKYAEAFKKAKRTSVMIAKLANEYAKDGQAVEEQNACYILQRGCAKEMDTFSNAILKEFGLTYDEARIIASMFL